MRDMNRFVLRNLENVSENCIQTLSTLQKQNNPCLHYVLVGWPTRGVSEDEQSTIATCDLSRHRDYTQDTEQNAEKWVLDLATRIKKHLEKTKERPLLCLLPTLTNPDRDRPVFDTIRSYFFSDNSATLEHTVLMVGDLPTYLAMGIETNTTSTLRKEIGDNLWLVDYYGEPNPALAWLSGGDPDLIRELTRDGPGTTSGDQAKALRSAVHRVVVNLLLQDAQAGSLESRLRRSIGAPKAPTHLDMEDTYHRDELCARLRGFLPGHLPDDQEGIEFRLASDGLKRLRRQSVWHGFSACTLPEKGLVAAGLLGFAADDEGGYPHLCLRSPLFAYAAARRALGTGLWKPKTDELSSLVSGKLKSVRPSEQPIDLDLFLDRLLDIATERDPDSEGWLLAPVSGMRKSAKAVTGEWWERFPDVSIKGEDHGKR